MPAAPEQHCSPQPTVETIDVTPELAETLLTKNPANRNLRKPVVDSYARDMGAGRWALNGETVKIDRDGRLLDGQHRLSAIVQSQATVPMIVVRGIEAEVMLTVDAGAKRTYSDALKLQGEDNTATLAAVARRAVMWERGMRTNTGAIKPTPLEMNDFIERHPEIRASAELAARLASRESLPASVYGLCHFLFAKTDAEAATAFLMRVADGEHLSSSDPIAQLRSRITRLGVRGGRINETVGLALTIRAWNAHRSGQSRAKLQLPSGGLDERELPGASVTPANLVVTTRFLPNAVHTLSILGGKLGSNSKLLGDTVDDVEGQQLVAGLRKFGSEATRIEAKRAATKLPTTTKDSVVAFSNSSAGGTVILGLDESDDFKPVGVEDPAKIQADFASMCAEEIQPPIRPEITLVEVEGATLVVAEIEPLPKEQRPAYVKARGMDRGSYVRVGESDRRLTSEEVQQLIAERGQPVFDREPVPGTSVLDLDGDMLSRYTQRLRETQPHLFGSESDETLLAMTNVTTQAKDGSATLTLAGLLSMGRYPQQFFPQLNATLVVYADSEGVSSDDGVRFLDNVRLDGSIPVMVREAMGAIRRNMSRRALVTGEGRRDIYDYPPEALREVVVNAMVHRDLSPGARGTQVQIEMYPDRITFKNPGGLFGSVDITQLGEAGTSSARNGSLLKMLEDVLIPGENRAICENRGSGIRAVKAAMRAAGMTPPEFRDSVTAFTVTLPNHALFDAATVDWLSQINQEGLKDSQATALAMMRRGQVFDNSTYRAATGNADSHSARVELQDLVARELVLQTGTRGSTKYYLSEYAAAVGTQGQGGRVIRPDRRRQITGLLALHGSLSKTDIATRLGISPKTAEHYLRQLKQEGHVESSDSGRGQRFTKYALTQAGDEVPLF